MKNTVNKVVKKPAPNHDSKFWIHPDDFNKVISYAAASYSEYKAEIGGQMIVLQDNEGDYILKFPEIMKQTVSGGECNLDAAELALYYVRNAKEHGKNVRFCWWHSHHTMGAFWSGTDDHTILTNVAKDWSISLVVNLKKEYKLRIQFFEPFLHEENVDLNFLTEESEINDTILQEVKEKCTKEAVVPQTYTNGYKQQTLLPDTSVYGYGHDYIYGNYNGRTNAYFNRTGIPKKVFEDAEQDIDKLLDDINLLTTGEEGLRFYNEQITKLNKDYKKYNFQVKEFTDAMELERAILACWPEDFFENIKKGAVA
tara:strand:- start:87 stop:1022 length:936 start_codon:yes stop_codon:yes gene_type:complete